MQRTETRAHQWISLKSGLALKVFMLHSRLLNRCSICASEAAVGHFFKFQLWMPCFVINLQKALRFLCGEARV